MKDCQYYDTRKHEKNLFNDQRSILVEFWRLTDPVERLLFVALSVTHQFSSNDKKRNQRTLDSTRDGLSKAYKPTKLSPGTASLSPKSTTD